MVADKFTKRLDRLNRVTVAQDLGRAVTVRIVGITAGEGCCIAE